jgi:hypothetical protein
MKEKLLELTQFNWLYDHWKNLVSQLNKKDVNIIVTDLDDTIFSRKEQLEKSEELRKNRWINGNTKIINEIWIKNYINTWVKWKSYPKNIISLLNKKTDVIITAGFLEIQKLKVKELWISDYKMIVVDEWKDKIISTIQYIIYDLGFIPSSITIYEDRPEFFVKYNDLLSDILWTKIIVNKVHMISNDIDAEIIEIKK